jgi:hypothetical protein
MKLEIFKTPQEQATGLFKYAKVPPGTLFLFPNVQSYMLTTVGMPEPIRVALLDTHLNFVPLNFYLEAMVEPGRTLVLPATTRHAIEAHQDVSIMQALANTALWRKVQYAFMG